MAARLGRQKRPEGVGRLTRKTSVNITLSSWEIAEAAAAALGISRDAYIEALLARETFDDRGRPTWWAEDRPDWWIDPAAQEELPLKTA